MGLFSEFQDGRHLGFSRWPSKPNFAYNSRTKHDREKNSTGIPSFRVIESNKTIFKIPRWPPSWNFKMAAIQNLILL